MELLLFWMLMSAEPKKGFHPRNALAEVNRIKSEFDAEFKRIWMDSENNKT